MKSVKKRKKAQKSDWSIYKPGKIDKMEFAGWLLFTVIYAFVAGAIYYYVYNFLPKEVVIYGFGIHIQETVKIIVLGVLAVITAWLNAHFKKD